MLKGHRIICFAPDHRPHTDRDRPLEIMHHLADANDVLYVETKGQDEPVSEQMADFWRVRLAWLGGECEPDISRCGHVIIFRPLSSSRSAPGDPRFSLGFDVSQFCSTFHLQPTLLWIANPACEAACRWYPALPVVYHVMDDLYARPRQRYRDATRTLHERLVARSDVVACSSAAVADELRLRRPAGVHWLPHPIASDAFAVPDQPADWLDDVPRPIAGYYGPLTVHHNAALIAWCAERAPDISFVLACDEMDRRHWPLLDHDNIHVLEGIDDDDVSALLHGFDVALLPISRGSWLARGDPPQLLPYLAAGRPIVSTDVPQVRRLCDGLATVAMTNAGFLAGIRRALRLGDATRAARRRALAAKHDWGVYLERVAELIEPLRCEPIDALDSYRRFFEPGLAALEAALRARRDAGESAGSYDLGLFERFLEAATIGANVRFLTDLDRRLGPFPSSSLDPRCPRSQFPRSLDRLIP